MVTRIELRIFDQIVMSVSFGPKNGNPPRNAGTLKTIVAKRLNWQTCRLGVSYLFMKYDVFRQGMELISFNKPSSMKRGVV